MRSPALFAVLALATAPAAAAAAQTAGPIMVSDAWSRPAVQGTNAAGFMTLMNHGRSPAALTKVESPLARKVEMHRSSMAGGVMSMSPQAKVDIPPMGMTTFAPGGYHLMFMGVSKTLKTGDRLPATLTFSGGQKIKVEFSVGMGPAGAAQPMEHMGH